VCAGPFLEKHLEVLQEYTDQFLHAQAGARFIAKDIAANVKDREEWVQARRRENEKRRAEGLEPLPEVDASLPFFKPVVDKSGRDPLDTLLLSAQITSYCSSVTRFADQSFGKLFLASSLSQNS
jgi:translation initiation factor 3 subunit H